jgi:hypothetical protein
VNNKHWLYRGSCKGKSKGVGGRRKITEENIDKIIKRKKYSERK